MKSARRPIPNMIRLSCGLLLVSALLGAALGGVRGALAFVLILGLALLVTFILSEKLYLRCFGSLEPASGPVMETIRLALASETLPNVFWVDQARPDFWVGRGPFSRGTLLLTRGLVAILEENELRSVVHVASSLLEEPGAACRTWNAWLLMKIDAIASGFSPGRARLSLSRGFLMILLGPVHRLFLEAGEPRLPPSSDEWLGALEKVERLHRIFGASDKRGSAFAGLVNPDFQR